MKLNFIYRKSNVLLLNSTFHFNTMNVFDTTDLSEFLPKRVVIPENYVGSGVYSHALMRKYEYFELRKKNNTASYKFKFLYPHQEFVRRFMSPETNNDRLLMFHNTGSGKSFTAVAVCETYRHINTKCLILVKGEVSEQSFRKKIEEFHQRNGVTEITSDILSYYDIHRFISFARRLKSSPESCELYSNCVIVVDEVHNIKSGISNEVDIDDENDDDETNNYEIVHQELVKLLNRVKNSRVLLLSATPIFDKPSEIRSIFGLLIPNYVDRLSDIASETFHFSVENITRIFPREMQGRVSFYNKTTNMPRLEYIGHNEYDGVTYTRNMFVSHFGSEQERVWEKVNQMVTSKDPIFIDRTYCSMFAYNGSTGDELRDRYTTRKKSDTTFQTEVAHIVGLKDELKNDIRKDFDSVLDMCGCKIKSMLNQFDENTGSIYIYCQAVKGSGLVFLAAILEEYGYIRYTDHTTMPVTEQKRFIMCTGEKALTPHNNELIDFFNREENKYGKLIQIFLGSGVVSECINLMNVRQVHILTPHWNFSVIDQAVGRAVRTNSHSMLPSHEHVVKVYNHYAVSRTAKRSNSPLYAYSIDAYRYKRSQNKADNIKYINEVLQNQSIDYYLNSDIETHFEDFGTDKSTYNLYHTSVIKHELYNCLYSDFVSGKELVSINHLCVKFNVNSDVIVKCVNDIAIDGEFVFYDKFNTRRYVKNSGYGYIIIDSLRDIYCGPLDILALDPELTYEESIEPISYSNKPFDFIKSAKDNFETRLTLYQYNNDELVTLFETWFDVDINSHIRDKLFEFFRFDIDGKVYHTIKYSKIKADGKYNASVTKIPADGRTRVYDNKKWKYIGDVMDQRTTSTLESKINRELNNKYKALDLKYPLYVRICCCDHTLKYRRNSDKVDDTSSRTQKKSNKTKKSSKDRRTTLRGITEKYIPEDQLFEMILSLYRIYKNDQRLVELFNENNIIDINNIGNLNKAMLLTLLRCMVKVLGFFILD